MYCHHEWESLPSVAVLDLMLRLGSIRSRTGTDGRLSHMSVNEMWVKIQNMLFRGCREVYSNKNDQKSTVCHGSMPQRLMKRRQKLYLRARKSNDPDVENHYKWFRAHIQKVERDAYWKHFSNIFIFENDPSDPDSNKSGKIKKF